MNEHKNRTIIDAEHGESRWFFYDSPNALVCYEICARTRSLAYSPSHSSRQQVICANVLSIDNCSCCCLTPNLPLDSACTFDTYTHYTHTHTNEIHFVYFSSSASASFYHLSSFSVHSSIYYAIHFDKWPIFMKEQQQPQQTTREKEEGKKMISCVVYLHFMCTKSGHIIYLRRNKENE